MSGEGGQHDLDSPLRKLELAHSAGMACARRERKGGGQGKGERGEEGLDREISYDEKGRKGRE